MTKYCRTISKFTKKDVNVMYKGRWEKTLMSTKTVEV